MVESDSSNAIAWVSNRKPFPWRFQFLFIPFGAGRRICLGLPLASGTIPMILGSLIHAFDWCLPDGMPGAQLEMKEKMSLTLVRDPSLVAVPKIRA